MVQPDLTELLAGRDAELVMEKPLELAPGKGMAISHRFEIDFFCKTPSHLVENIDKPWMTDANFCGDRQALVSVAEPVDAIQAHLEYTRRKPFTMLLLDERHHHVDAGVATATGDECAIPAVKLIGWWKLRKAFLEGRLVLPVEGESLTGKHSGAGQCKGTGTQSTNSAAVLGE